MKKSTLILFALLAGAFSADAAWKGLGESAWYSGPKITEADLAGKVVLVDMWGVNCLPCCALLPKMQKIWSSFKSKPFMLIGSHRQGRQVARVEELVKANKLTYPMYDYAGLVGEPSSGGGIPFLYVVNHRGKVVYAGRSEPEATEAVVNALGEIGAQPSLTGGFVFGKKSVWKSLEKQLELGKPVAGAVKKLEKAVKDAEKKSAKQADKDAAEEAKKLLEAIESCHKDIKTDIEVAKTTNPEEAHKLASLLVKSFPEEKELKAELPEMKKAAAAWKAEQKEKAKEAAKSGKAKGAK